jgi:4-aminobutyrate aminotransferase-like enzyme/Ser/Thr protein kinase RdoA (MazF antagonist)
MIKNPDLGADRAAELLARHWGLAGELGALASLQEQNFTLTCPDGQRFVVKIAHRAAVGERTALEHAVLRHLAAGAGGFDSPLPVPAKDGRDLVDADAYAVRVLSWVHGVPLSARGALGDRGRYDLGVLAAKATVALAGFEHPAMDSDSVWDVRRSGQMLGALRHSVAEKEQHLLDTAMRAFEQVAHHAADLPMQVVHTDVTAANAVSRDRATGLWTPTGIIDFGDVVRTWRVADVVATASDVAGRPDTEDALDAVTAVLVGYHSVCPLSAPEIDAIWPLTLARSGVTLAISAEQVRLAGTNDYARETGAEALLALRRLCRIPARLAVAALRHSVALDPYPPGAALGRWLRQVEPAPMLPELAAVPVDPLDLSVASERFTAGQWLDDAATDGLLADAGFGVSRWAECRLIDTSGPQRSWPHNLALGAEVWGPAGTAVCAPVPATVHAVSTDEVVLDLRPAGAAAFLAVSGLQADARLAVGGQVPAGAALGRGAGDDAGRARVGVQLRVEADLPRRGQPQFRAAWLALCPDPSPLLGIDAAAPPAVPPEQRRAMREAHVARSQHLYYRRPIEFVRGWRHFLYDADGRPYLDMINNIASVGHSHPRIAAAAARQFRMLNTNSRFMYSAMERYSSRVAELLPPELDSVFLVNSGSEAADLALQLARVFTRRRDVIALQGAYHGWTGSVLALCTSPQDRPHWRDELEPWVHVAEQPDPYRGRFGADAARYCESVRAACAAAEPAGGVAAFVCEPLLGNQGGIEPPPGYLAGAYAAVREAGGLCVADEVQVGMGRTGEHFWAFEHEGVLPDIVYTAKATGNGHPLGVVACRREIADAFDGHTSYFSSTGGGPVSCEIGLAVLDVIRDEALQQNARQVGGYLKRQLGELASGHPLIGAVHGRGLYLGVDLVRDPEAKTPAVEEAMLVSEHLRELGVIMQPTGDAFNVLKVKPPLCLDRKAADYFLAAVDTAMGAVE